MKIAELTNEQRRQLINVKQAFQVWRAAQRQFTNSYKGTVSWRKSKGHEYLYRTVYRGEHEISKSLGPRSPRTEKVEGVVLEKGLMEALTRPLMAVRPNLVAKERIPLARANTTPEVKDLVGGGIYRWRSIGSMSASGVVGHPEPASATKGQDLLRAITETLASKLLNEELWTLPWQSDPVQT
jgi:hypothetical protein